MIRCSVPKGLGTCCVALGDGETRGARCQETPLRLSWPMLAGRASLHFRHMLASCFAGKFVRPRIKMGCIHKAAGAWVCGATSGQRGKKGARDPCNLGSATTSWGNFLVNKIKWRGALGELRDESIFAGHQCLTLGIWVFTPSFAAVRSQFC